MLKRSSTNYAVTLLFLDLCFTWIALYLASVARSQLPFGAELGRATTAQLPVQVYVMASVLWPVIFVLLSVYDVRYRPSLIEQLERGIVAISVATLVFAGALYFTFRDVPRLLFAYFFLLDLLLLVGLRLIVPFLLGRARGESHTIRVLIVGAGKVGQQVAQAIKRRESSGFKAVGYLDDDPDKQGTKPGGLPVLARLSEASTVIQREGVNQVILALPLRAHRKMVSLVTDLEKLPVDVKVVPDLFDLALHRASIDHVGGIPLIGLRDSALDGFQRMSKRVFDLTIAIPLTILLSPLMLLVAILIKRDSRGPVIFRQERVGENCELFRMYKFRSMVEDAEARLGDIVQETEDGQILHKQRTDPRVTRIGRVLRHASIDELPQLLNVIKGEMSLVGPRPELPFLVEQYEPWQRKRFAIPPGITGYWQIRGRSERPMHLHVNDDLYYIQNHSLLLDLHILLKTIGAVLRGRGAY
jgi:exopolysaccharide biosynthesis polyprenyl glycosylphosphotransferase